MKTLLKIIICALFVSFVVISCKTTEYVTKIEKVHDTIHIEKTITDTIIQEKEIEKIREIKSNVFLPCPKDGEKGSSGRNQSGDNYADWQYDDEKGGYDVELYCAEQINQKDSIIHKLKEELKFLVIKKIENKEYKEKEVTQKTYWWQRLAKEIWKVLFFAIAILWVFGVTPKWILKRVF